MPNTQDLYDYLKANGALSDSVSFDAFSAEMQDDARRKSLYGYMGENGFLSEGTPYSDFRGTFDTPLESLGNTAKGVIESFGRGAEGLVGGAASLTGKVIPGNDWFEGFAKASKDAAIQRERAGITSGPQNTYEGAKRQLDRGDILGAAGQFAGATLETAAGSAPGMSTMAMPGGGALFWGSQMENMANQRAENDGRESPNAADYALSAPSAAMQAALEKLGIKGLSNNPFTKKLSDGLMARLGKDGMNLFLKSLNEAGTEGGQQLLQYATEVVNTNKPFDWGEARRQATIAAVGGFGLGAGIGAAQNALVNTSPEAQVADAINAQVDGADISALKVPDFRQEVAPSAGAVMAEQMMGPKPTEAPFAKAPDVQYPDALAETLREQSVPPVQEPKLLPAYAEQVVSEPQAQQDVAQDGVISDESGNALTLYHGTTSGDFAEFKPNNDKSGGIWFTDSERIARDVYAGGFDAIDMSGVNQKLNAMSEAELDKMASWLERDGNTLSFLEWESMKDDGASKSELAQFLSDSIEHSSDASEGDNEVVDRVAKLFGVKSRKPASGSFVHKVNLRMQSPLIIDAQGGHYNQAEQAAWMADAKAAGKDGVVIKNYNDGGFGIGNTFKSAGEHTVYIVFDPKQVVKPQTKQDVAQDVVKPDERVADADARITQWRDEWARLKKTGDLHQMNEFGVKVGAVLNGIAQKYGEGVVDQFRALQKEMKEYAISRNSDTAKAQVASEQPKPNAPEADGQKVSVEEPLSRARKARANKALEKSIRYRGRQMTKRAMMDLLHSEGYVPTIGSVADASARARDEDIVASAKRKGYIFTKDRAVSNPNLTDVKEGMAAARRLDENDYSKNEYRVERDGLFLVISKAEYDYLSSLSPQSAAQEATPPQQVPTVTPAESVGGTLVDAQPTTDSDIETQAAIKADGQVDYVPVNEAKSVLDAFESMKIVDQTYSMANTLERKKTGKKEFKFDRFAKSQRVRKEMLSKGYIKPNNTLTKEGERLLAEIKQNTQALSDGIPMDTYKKKKVSKMKYDPLRGALVGTFYGKPAHSNGHVLLQGNPDIGPESRTGVDMSKVAPEEPTGKPYARAVAWGGSGINASSARLLYLNDGETTTAVDADLYDYVTGKVKGAQFRITDPTGAIYIYSKGDVVGLLMPVRMEGGKAPVGVQRLANQSGDNLGRPGASTSIELNPTKEFKPIRFLERLEVSEIVEPETKRDIKSWWYEPVSHMETETKAAEWVKDMTPEVAAEFAMDANTKVDPTTRNFIGMAAGKKLNDMAAKARKDGDAVAADDLSRRAAAVYQFVGEKGTELGRAVEILKTFDQDNPAKVIGEYKKSVDEAREGVAPVVGDIVAEVKQVQGDTAGQAVDAGNVVDVIKKVARKRAGVSNGDDATGSVGGRGKSLSKPKSEERGIWEHYVNSISDKMDVVAQAKGAEKERGALQDFASTVTKSFLEKIRKPDVVGRAKRPTVSVVRDQIANSKELFAAWKDARERILKKSPNSEQLSLLIPEEIAVPFSVSDIRKVMREVGAFDVNRIARTWGEDRSALTESVVTTLMEGQDMLGPKEYIEMERGLRGMIDSIIETEKARMAEVQQKLAEARARRERERAAVREAANGGPLGERVKAGAARGIAQKLSASIAPGKQMTNLQIFSRNLISAMSEKLPAREGSAAKPNYDALLEDAVLNKDAYMYAWEKARAITLDKHPEAADTINRVFDDVDSAIPMKAVRGAIQQELEAMQTSLSEVARQHYTTLALTGKHLAVRIAERLNISNAEASELADVIDAEYRRMVGKRIASTLRALSKKRADVRRVIKSDIERIVELSNLGALNDEAIYNAVSGRLNLPPYNPEVVGKLNQFASELQELSYLDEGFGRSVEYWQKRKEMLDYRLSLTPSHKLKVATAVVSRGIMLMSIKSPITNIVGNSVLSVTESLSRRLVNKRMNGVNGEYAMQYFKYVQEVYQKSGYDPTRMVSLAEDQKRLGEKVVNTQGEGRTRGTGRFVEDIVFKQMMGAPDVAFAAAHFVDTANILTTNAARAEGLINEKQVQARALEIFKDAVKIEPETEIGKAVREKAIADAKRATLTDDTYASKAALNARNLINDLTGDLMLGDLIVPFAKTPANVVMRAIEASGVKLPYDLYNIAFGVKNGDVEQVSRGMRGAAMAGIGVVGAHLLAALLDPDDFEGEYFMADSKEKTLIRSIGGSYTAFKIGNTWVSADYFGPFAAALVGIMNDKKYGKGRGVINRAGNYYASVFGQLTRIPGLNELADVVDGVKQAVKDLYQHKKDFTDLGSDAVSGLIDFATPRIIPALLSDVASAFDPYRRDIDGPVGSVMYRVPGLRNQLPEKLDLFGRPIENQSPVTAILFGARFREGRDSELLNELQRLNAGGQLPTIEDIRYTSTRVKKLREQLGEKDFKRAMRYFGDEFTKRATSLIHSSRYRRMTDEERKEAWGDVRSDSRNMMLRRFRYRK